MRILRTVRATYRYGVSLTVVSSQQASAGMAQRHTGSLVNVLRWQTLLYGYTQATEYPQWWWQGA